MARKPLLPPAYMLAALLLMAGLHLVTPGPQLVPYPSSLLGLVPAALGVALTLAAHRAFQRAQTTIKPFEHSTVLITEGIYRWSRNPMYVGLVLVLTGIAVVLGSMTPWLIVPVFAAAMDRRFVRAEEAMLADRFGRDWDAYRQRVRRWL